MITRTITLFVCGTLLAVTAGADPVQQDQDVAAMIARADRLFADQNWTQAADAYRAVTRADTRNAQAWFRLGYSLHAAGKLEEALAAHAKAGQFPSVRPTALYNLGRAHALLGHKDAAFAALNDAVDAGFANRAQVMADLDLAALRSDGRYNALVARLGGGKTPDVRRQLDFWIGDWRAVSKDGKVLGENRIELKLNGNLILENWTSARGGQGKSMNYYDQATRKWRQVWVSDSGAVTTFEGGISNGAMRLEGVSVRPDGSLTRARLALTPRPDGTVHHFSQHSKDDGKTWFTYFDGTYARWEIPQTERRDTLRPPPVEKEAPPAKPKDDQ